MSHIILPLYHFGPPPPPSFCPPGNCFMISVIYPCPVSFYPLDSFCPLSFCPWKWFNDLHFLPMSRIILPPALDFVFILIKSPLQQKLMTGTHPVTVAPLVYPFQSFDKDGCPGLWLAETFSTSLQLLNGIWWNLTKNKHSTSSKKFVVFGLIRQQRLPPWLLIGWDIFNFSFATAEPNRKKLTGSNLLPSLCISCWSVNNRGTWYSRSRYEALWASCF